MSKLLENWAKQIYWQGNEDELFDALKANFIKADEATRLGDLKFIDDCLSEETQLTREASSILAKKRQLEDLHLLLKRAGR